MVGCLQEYCMRQNLPIPTYESTSLQQPHQMTCVLGKKTTATGFCRQSAKHNAARSMLEKLNNGSVPLQNGQVKTLT